jgi:molybdopterin converting factor small subunit
MPIVFLPTPLRKFANHQSRVNIAGDTVGSVMSMLRNQYPDMEKYLFDGSGQIRTFINVFVDDDDIRNLKNEETSVAEASVISIVPAIAGGAH